MNEGAVTARYAKALYQIGEEEGRINDIRNDVIYLEQTIKESPEFINFLHSPIIKETEKSRLMEQLFKTSVDPLTLSFLLLLTKNKREHFLPSICRFFQQIFKEKMGIKEGSIITAQPLTKEYKDTVNQYIRKKFKFDIELSEKVDPSIIGGFILRIEDQQIDASIATKLKKIRLELINS
jgi:F-type H+-transporting ATPase subunit delta